MSESLQPVPIATTDRKGLAMQTLLRAGVVLCLFTGACFGQNLLEIVNEFGETVFLNRERIMAGLDCNDPLKADTEEFSVPARVASQEVRC